MMIAQACDPHSCLRVAREAGIWVTPVRDRAVEMCLPLAGKMVGSLDIPAISRVEREDLQQAAAMAIVEGVDSFEPHRGVQIQTHLWMRMKWRIKHECWQSHWTIRRPTRKQFEAYMKHELVGSEREAYLQSFVIATQPIDEDTW